MFFSMFSMHMIHTILFQNNVNFFLKECMCRRIERIMYVCIYHSLSSLIESMCLDSKVGYLVDTI